MEQGSHIILRLRAEAERKRDAALARAEKAQREADHHAVEIDAYNKAIHALGGETGAQETKKPSVKQEGKPRAGASEKWLLIYKALHERSEAPYTYEDLSKALEATNNKASRAGQRTQMMNAVNAGLFERVGHGQFAFTDTGLELIGATRKENEPPKGGSEAEEDRNSSSETQQDIFQGRPSANPPDPEGQTRHWKMPGT